MGKISNKVVKVSTVATGGNRAGQRIQLSRKTIFVSVTKALAGKIPGTPSNLPREDIARGFWLVNLAKARQCELLAAVRKNVVVGLWEIDKKFGWQPMRFGAIHLRTYPTVDPQKSYCQVTKPATDIQLGTLVPNVANMKSMCGPVQYNF